MATPSPESVLHLAALHTLSQAGFASTSSAASITLSTVLTKYLKLVATTCVERATLAGRGKVAAIDVVDALDDLGVRVDELIDWSCEQNGDYLMNDALGNLQDYLEEGLSVEYGIAQMRLVPEEELEADEYENENGLEEDHENGDDSNQQDEDVSMEQDDAEYKDVNPKTEPDLEEGIEYKPYIYRPKSPDLSWLPPLPSSTTTGVTSQNTQPSVSASNDSDQPPSQPAPLPAPSQSIADRYRNPIPYSSSQLSQAHPFHDPPRPTITKQLPPTPTSLPNLISTYSAIANDPSIALRQTELRRQATEILRQSICTVDSYSPKPTLSTPIPPVRSSSIVPSHSDILPTKLLPVNPNSSNGILSSLVNQINSPNLPYGLKERLTSLRPPVVQNKNDKQIFYNENFKVKGPDELTLLKFKGKQISSNNTNINGEGEEGDNNNNNNLGKEIILKQTWDSGLRGFEKWSKPNLPKGKKVINQKDGEKKPRMLEIDLIRLQKEQEENERKSLEEQQNQSNNQNQKVKVNLRLPSFNGINNNISGGDESFNSIQANNSEDSTHTSNRNVRISLSPTQPTSIPSTNNVNGVATPGPGLKIKFGGNSSKLSNSPSPQPAITPKTEYPASVNPYN